MQPASRQFLLARGLHHSQAMRLGIIIVGALLVAGITRSASADSRHVDASWATPAMRAALLDGYHHASAKRVDLGRFEHRTGTTSGEADAPEVVSQAIERMWSQVRAYHRPGGAEVIIRGRF